MGFFRNLVLCLTGVDWALDIRQDQVVLVQGKLTDSCVREFAMILKEHAVREGWIRGIKSGGHVRLEFSKSIPSAARQRLRNVWSVWASKCGW